jgi:hypothetical protein
VSHGVEVAPGVKRRTDGPEVGFCPRCGQSLTTGASFLQEFWVAAETVYYCWCALCSWRGEVKTVTRVIGVEPAEDDGLPGVEELESLFRRS